MAAMGAVVVAVAVAEEEEDSIQVTYGVPFQFYRNFMGNFYAGYPKP